MYTSALVPLPFFELQSTIYASIKILPFFPCTTVVHLQQTIPENGAVCPGGKLQYTCTAVDELSWEIASSIPVTFTTDMEVNSTGTINDFSLLLTEKTTTDAGTKIITTATNDMVTSNNNSQQVVCYSGALISARYIKVAGRVVL